MNKNEDFAIIALVKIKNEDVYHYITYLITDN